MKEYLLIALALLGVLILGGIGLVVPRLRRRPEPPLPRTEVDTRAEEGLAGPPVQAPEAELSTGVLVEPPPVVAPPAVEVPEPTAGRLVRLRSRLSRSQTVFGKGLLGLLSRDRLDEDVWEEIEDNLITADVGIDATREIVDRLRERTRVLGTRTAAELRALLAAELVNALDPGLDRSLRTAPKEGVPAVLLVVGVNGAGKTTTCGKIARVLIADGRSVLLGAADTFRAAAADQLQTWAGRVGAETVRGPEGADPASVAFDAVKRGIDTGVDTVLVDTAGRLQNKVGLMDELGKVKRVVEKHGPIDETLLILDATTGQNGLEQARVFTEVVNVTGVVLTKLDGTAKGGIVIAVQRKLGIPVKLVGLGEGPDDLAPFDPAQFVDALLGTDAPGPTA
ncbi:signal recognition particle-docking protein FtsY [Micromonospora zingiberis]|uniref:Signal recognition particle receptor FtsY n=1 Tax=Micromonospora zingiberis TaxID=2053011 RepID=A0A4R0GFS7_9ACTN|nr:signal recognition particle-docking protein FtsY [Micromonospora zingiberis]TCB96150.1 signal recognition particle-docking protein FtsY [Micromonospora zingiberis]